MLKFLLCVGIVAFVYFIGVGFLHTANQFGWSDSVEQKPQSTQRR
jgi:hypothetical protein